MDIELKNLLEEQAKAFESLKKSNDERLAALEKKGTVDPLVKESLDKANKAISDLQEQVKTVAITNRRPDIEVKGFDGRTLPKEEIEQKSALIAYAMKGDERLSELEKKALVSSDDPNGGYFLPRDMSGRIIRKVFETSAMRQTASVQTIATDALEGPIDEDEVTVGMVGETATRSETTTPKAGKWRIPVHEGFAKPRASARILDDAPQVESWLTDKISEKLGRFQEQQFVNGDGNGKARGILTYTPTYTGSGSRSSGGTVRTVKTGTSADLPDSAADKIINAVMALKGVYRRRAKWLLSRQGIEKVRLLKMDGKYLWTPQNVSADAGSPTGVNAGTLHGYGIVETNDIPDLAANSIMGVFGDIAEMYQIVDRQGMRVLRDVYSAKPWIEFYTTARWGGDVLNFEAGIYLQASA